MTNANDVLVSVVAGISGIVVASFGTQQVVKHSQSRAKRKVSAIPAPQVELPASLPSDQMIFIRTLLARLDRAEANVEELKKVIESLKQESEYNHTEDLRFKEAVGRWLSRIYRGWGTTPQGPFPMPETDADMATLQEIIPGR